MAEKQSASSCYSSRHGGGWITIGAFLAERICENIARLERKSLGERFWADPVWKKTFIFQASLAAKLISGDNKWGVKYDPQVLINVLGSPSCNRIKSLGAMFILKPLLDAEQAKQDMIVANLTESPANQIDYESLRDEKPRPTVGRKNNLSKLRELD
jgi:hypothetical protein